MKKSLNEKIVSALLEDARNKLIDNDDSMRTLLSNLTGINKKKWTRRQCLEAFKNILLHYHRNKEEVEEILHVSGVTGKYVDKNGKRDSAEERRAKFMTDTNYGRGNDTLRKKENKILRKIANDILKDIDSEEIKTLFKEWIPNFEEMEADQDDSTPIEPLEPSLPSAIINNIVNIINNGLDKKTIVITSGVIASVIFLSAIFIISSKFSQSNENNEDNSKTQNVHIALEDSEEPNINIFNGNMNATKVNNNDEDSENYSRPHYTTDQIDAGVLSDRIIFNSITDNPNIDNWDDHDEHNFVVARDADKNTAWQSKEIEIKNDPSYNDKEYEVCVRIKNDNPNGMDAIAEDTKVFLEKINSSATTIPLQGSISSENARPKRYESILYFHSDIKFSLEYVQDSARFISDGIDKENGIMLNDIFDVDGIDVGYDGLNGRVPGGDKYACSIIFKVRAVFDAKDTHFKTTSEVRLADSKDKTWKKKVSAKIGDKVEFQVEYINIGQDTQYNVVIDSQLPYNLRYVPGSTKLYNGNHKKGLLVDSDKVTSTGINIGNYEKNSNAFVRFTAEVFDETFTCGLYTLNTWIRATVDYQRVEQDCAAVDVQLPHCPELKNTDTIE